MLLQGPGATGDLGLEMFRDLLRDQPGEEARGLLAKVTDERGVNDMMIVVADCLLDVVQTAITDDVFRGVLKTYAES